MRGSTERISLPTCSQVRFLVVQISPDLITTIFYMFSSCTKTTGLAHCDKLKYFVFKTKYQPEKEESANVFINKRNPQMSINYFKGCVISLTNMYTTNILSHIIHREKVLFFNLLSHTIFDKITKYVRLCKIETWSSSNSLIMRFPVDPTKISY